MEQVTVIQSMEVRSRQRSEKEIFQAIEEFGRRGNMTLTEFVERHQISKATFYNWRKRYHAKIQDRGSHQKFIPIRTADDMEAGVFAEVRDNAIRFYQRVDASYLKAFLK